MKPKLSLLLCFLLSLWMIPATDTSADNEATAEKPPLAVLKLSSAAMCESIQGYSPVNQSVVFSIAAGKVSCFSHFDPVPEKTHIHHRWYFRDKLSTQKKLTINPPSWSTYSSIQLREADKGPWRVEIVNKNGKVLETLRFSVTD